MTGKQFGRLAGIAAAMALLLAACGGDEPTATPTAPATPTAVPTATPTQEPGATPRPTATPLPTATPTPTVDPFQAEWDALIKAAQEEGELSLTFGGAAGRNFRPVANFFGEKFGIEMVIATGSGSANLNRVLAERETGRYLVDVMYGGATPFVSRMIPTNGLDPIADLFIHPEVTDKSLWYGGKHWYADPDQKFVFSFAANAGPTNLSMRYNTDLVTPEDIDAITSVFDYLDAKWKGKIVAHLPTGAGGGGTYHRVYVHPDIGPSWIDAFVSPELDVTFSNDARFIVDGIAKGKFAMGIAVGGAGRDLDSLGTLGAPVKALRKELKEGGQMSASGSVNLMTTPTRRPHPNAAKLWVNWWLSREGQTLMHTMSEVIPDPTLRVDVTDWGKTAEVDRRVEGKSYYFFGSDPVYAAKRQEALDYATAAYNAVR